MPASLNALLAVVTILSAQETDIFLVLLDRWTEEPSPSHRTVYPNSSNTVRSGSRGEESPSLKPGVSTVTRRPSAAITTGRAWGAAWGAAGVLIILTRVPGDVWSYNQITSLLYIRIHPAEA